MAIKDGELMCAFGVMGGFMQPQGHIQVLSNMIDFGLNPQQAIDAPRFCISSGFQDGTVYFEDGIDPSVIAELKQRGHRVHLQPVTGYDRNLFGNGFAHQPMHF